MKANKALLNKHVHQLYIAKSIVIDITISHIIYKALLA